MYNDPQSAAGLLGTLPLTQDNANFYQQLASQWAQNDLTSAINWVKQLPDGTANKTLSKASPACGRKPTPAEPLRSRSVCRQDRSRTIWLANIASNGRTVISRRPGHGR